jgi:hypothetical protein
MKMAVFWVVAPCSLVEVYQRFRGPCCLHRLTHRPDDGGSKDLNVGKLLPDYTVLQPRRQPSSASGLSVPSCSSCNIHRRCYRHNMPSVWDFSLFSSHKRTQRTQQSKQGYSAPFHFRMETDPVSETLCCSFWNTRRWTKFRNPSVLIVIYHHQNTSELIKLKCLPFFLRRNM